MPDRPQMKPRTIKVDDELWLAAQHAAAILDTDVSKEVRAGLRALVKRAARTAPKPTEEKP